mgnify:FL=1|jgi:hypothetical protein
MLGDARLELHWATQLVSAPGATWLPSEADHSHTNLGWDDALGVLVGRSVGDEHLRAALVLGSLELVVLEGERERATLGLAGRDMGSALTWLGEHMRRDAAEAPELPVHDMPDHPVSHGAPFSDGDPAGRAELEAWFSNASAAIYRAVADEPTASIVRCWPHHFDVASLVVLDVDADAEDARSIGVGFSPGDDSYSQPYFYVNPWPYPPADELPPLDEAARWHTEGWTGAVLTGEQVVDAGPSHQAALVDRELRRAIAACRAVLSL